MKKITGVIPAFISPFTEDGIDTKAAQAHAKRLVEKGANGLYVGGSTGEMIFMSVSEERLSSKRSSTLSRLIFR